MPVWKTNTIEICEWLMPGLPDAHFSKKVKGSLTGYGKKRLAK